MVPRPDAEQTSIIRGGSASSNLSYEHHPQNSRNSPHLSPSSSTSSLCQTPTADVNDQLTPNRPPLGFKNVGNTCYANAALQCLLSTALAHALLHPPSVEIFTTHSTNPNILKKGSGSVDEDETDEDEEELFTVGGGNRKPIEEMSEREKRRYDHYLRREARRKEKEKRICRETCSWLTGELTTITHKYIKGMDVEPPTQTEPSSSFTLFSFWSTPPPAPRIVDPGSVTRNPSRLSKCLRPYQQEDAHEFLRALLSTLVMDGQNRQLSSLFDGLLESAVTCQTCGRASLTRDRYMDLSLDIADEEVDDLVKALRKFTETEILDGDNKVTCGRCKAKRDVTKGLRLATAPTILICHLKRFAYNDQGMPIRLSKQVQYPTRLEIGDYMSLANRGKPPPYALVAVLVHSGRTCDSGHYVAYIKHGGLWYKANDSVVTQVDLEMVLEQRAYILLYEVEGMREQHGYGTFDRYRVRHPNRKGVDVLERLESRSEAGDDEEEDHKSVGSLLALPKSGGRSSSAPRPRRRDSSPLSERRHRSSKSKVRTRRSRSSSGRHRSSHSSSNRSSSRSRSRSRRHRHRHRHSSSVRQRGSPDRRKSLQRHYSYSTSNNSNTPTMSSDSSSSDSVLLNLFNMCGTGDAHDAILGGICCGTSHRQDSIRGDDYDAYGDYEERKDASSTGNRRSSSRDVRDGEERGEIREASQSRGRRSRRRVMARSPSPSSKNKSSENISINGRGKSTSQTDTSLNDVIGTESDDYVLMNSSYTKLPSVVGSDENESVKEAGRLLLETLKNHPPQHPQSPRISPPPDLAIQSRAPPTPESPASIKRRVSSGDLKAVELEAAKAYQASRISNPMPPIPPSPPPPPVASPAVTDVGGENTVSMVDSYSAGDAMASPSIKSDIGAAGGRKKGKTLARLLPTRGGGSNGSKDVPVDMSRPRSAFRKRSSTFHETSRTEKSEVGSVSSGVKRTDSDPMSSFRGLTASPLTGPSRKRSMSRGKLRDSALPPLPFK